MFEKIQNVFGRMNNNMKLPIIILVLGLVILILSLGMVFDLIPVLEGFKEAVIEFVGVLVGIYITINGLWKSMPEFMKRVIASLLRRVSNLPAYYKRKTVKYELEGEINEALKEFRGEGVGFVNMRWLWIG